MKQFYPTYLYIKTHNITGLKYFGKTTNDPHKYLGSGKRWRAHLRVHGNDIRTEILGYYINEVECRIAANTFSRDNDIAGSEMWANLIAENGTDGGATGRTNYSPMSDETKEKLSKSNKGKKPWNTGLRGVTPGNKKPKTIEQKKKISQSLTGRKRSPESVAKGAEKLKGRKRPEVSKKLTGRIISDQTKEKMSIAQQNRGPMSNETKEKIKEARKHQVITQETKDKLKGKVVCVNKDGTVVKIDKNVYYSQVGPKETWEWVAHNSREARMRR